MHCLGAQVRDSNGISELLLIQLKGKNELYIRGSSEIPLLSLTPGLFTALIIAGSSGHSFVRETETTFLLSKAIIMNMEKRKILGGKMYN